MKDLEALKNLGQYTGTEQYHRFSPLFPNLLITDGAMALAKSAEAFWLFDIIGSYQQICRKDPNLQNIQFWYLKKGPAPAQEELRKMSHNQMLVYQPQPDAVAHVICARDLNDDNTPDARIVQELEYTDFPFETLPEVQVWVEPEGKTYWVAYLPSEH